MIVVFYRRDDGTIRHFHDAGDTPLEKLLPMLKAYNSSCGRGEKAYFAEYAPGSFEEHLYKVARARTKLDAQDLRDLRSTLEEAENMLTDLIAEAERVERGEAV